MLTHSHAIELFTLICKEVKKIYWDHSYHQKLPLHGIALLIYVTQHMQQSQAQSFKDTNKGQQNVNKIFKSAPQSTGQEQLRTQSLDGCTYVK